MEVTEKTFRVKIQKLRIYDGFAEISLTDSEQQRIVPYIFKIRSPSPQNELFKCNVNSEKISAEHQQNRYGCLKIKSLNNNFFQSVIKIDRKGEHHSADRKSYGGIFFQNGFFLL
jgi:hypothetical protein